MKGKGYCYCVVVLEFFNTKFLKYKKVLYQKLKIKIVVANCKWCFTYFLVMSFLVVSLNLVFYDNQFYQFLADLTDLVVDFRFLFFAGAIYLIK